ncbi:YeeE/YedE thiosulfate transporter family protein [Clostridium amazonitimonense]|uniref:YeeE/YedE thiosulfate transporter family protein n=1 Tax=Clostridium amazonitimonense TaxID=1499689 RepID=UPI0005097EA8|nr:YeeE/YedE thiosulfate transporter family protein [Clostridium amazonitimonense]
MEIKNNPYYKKLLKEPWTYVTGAVILGLLNIGMFASTGKAWGVTTPLSYWGAWIYKFFGGNPESWYYFQQKSHAAALSGGFINDMHSISNIGIIIGAFLATLLASQFKIKKIKSLKQVIAAVLGGLLMGYGARISFGCNIGALFSGIASMSLHGWMYWIFIFIGAWIGSKLLVKYFM